MFFLLATRQSLAMVTRLAKRMEHEGTWDQSAWNQEQFLPAYGSHKAVGVSTRVMNYLCNLNSKTFFRFIREDSALLHPTLALALALTLALALALTPTLSLSRTAPCCTGTRRSRSTSTTTPRSPTG